MCKGENCDAILIPEGAQTRQSSCSGICAITYHSPALDDQSSMTNQRSLLTNYTENIKLSNTFPPRPVMFFESKEPSHATHHCPLAAERQGRGGRQSAATLRLLYDKQWLKLTRGDGLVLLRAFAKEQDATLFGDATSQIVQRFNTQYRQSDLNWVDDATTETLIKALAQLGALDAPADL